MQSTIRRAILKQDETYSKKDIDITVFKYDYLTKQKECLASFKDKSVYIQI